MGENELSEYEIQRLQRIKENQAMLEQLLPDLDATKTSLKAIQHPEKRQRRKMGPYRKRDSVTRRNPARSAKKITSYVGLGERDGDENVKERKRSDSDPNYSSCSGVDDDDSSDEAEKRSSSKGKRKKTFVMEYQSDEEIDIASLKPAYTVQDKVYHRIRGTCCHQCRQKTLDTKTRCRNRLCRGTRGQFCGVCLQNRYGEDIISAIKNKKWACPVCRGICNCSVCLTRKGIPPTGVLYPQAKEEGYSCVKDYLSSVEEYCCEIQFSSDDEDDDDNFSDGSSVPSEIAYAASKLPRSDELEQYQEQTEIKKERVPIEDKPTNNKFIKSARTAHSRGNVKVSCESKAHDGAKMTNGTKVTSDQPGTDYFKSIKLEPRHPEIKISKGNKEKEIFSRKKLKTNGELLQSTTEKKSTSLHPPCGRWIDSTDSSDSSTESDDNNVLESIKVFLSDDELSCGEKPRQPLKNERPRGRVANKRKAEPKRKVQHKRARKTVHARRNYTTSASSEVSPVKLSPISDRKNMFKVRADNSD